MSNNTPNERYFNGSLIAMAASSVIFSPLLADYFLGNQEVSTVLALTTIQTLLCLNAIYSIHSYENNKF